MRRLYQVASLVFIAVGGYVVQEARDLTLFTELGPGPGFFPFWLGLLFMGISAAWLGQVTIQPSEPIADDLVPNRLGALRSLSIVVALVLFTLLVGTLGFKVTMLAFLLFMLFALGRQNPVLTVLISLVGSFGVFYVFKVWLNVHLPESSIELLQNLGL